jgi:SHS2 domain-containing protein
VAYRYLDDGVTSDVTFEVTAASLSALFHDAAEATTHLMVESLDTVRPQASVAVALHAPAVDLLLVRFLEELVFRKDAHGTLLRPTTVDVFAEGDGYALDAALAGEPIDPARHALGVDVKAVTLHGLSVDRDDDAWRAQVTVDV